LTRSVPIRPQPIDAGLGHLTSERLGHKKPDISLRICAHLFQKDDGKATATIFRFRSIVFLGGRNDSVKGGRVA